MSILSWWIVVGQDQLPRRAQVLQQVTVGSHDEEGLGVNDPLVQRAYAECAEGYGFKIDACPPHPSLNGSALVMAVCADDQAGLARIRSSAGIKMRRMTFPKGERLACQFFRGGSSWVRTSYLGARRYFSRSLSVPTTKKVLVSTTRS